MIRLTGRLCRLLSLIVFVWVVVFYVPALAQEGPVATPTVTSEEKPIPAPDKVQVQPTARDDEIHLRLERILKATGWFTNPKAQVQDGVVLLQGQTQTDEFKKWAGDLARSTQDVVAVMNQIEVIPPSVWDLQPALMVLGELGRGVVRGLPRIGVGVIVLAATWGAVLLSVAGARVSLRRRLSNTFLVSVIARGIGLCVFLAGLYVAFYVAGLTSIALTIVGGTGLLGLVLGIAFRDITENFLASIFLSVQNPFHSGDVVEIAGVTGSVQKLTTRATVLLTFDGTYVQIPNATVYKSNIHNYTTNPNRRADLIVGIGYDASIPTAQEVAMNVLDEHPAVLKEPEPWVLVESLGSSTVNLRVYFWVDSSQYSWLKVKSSVIRLTISAFQAAGISMPDEARELVFPDGVPVHWLETDAEKPAGQPPHRTDLPQTDEGGQRVSTGAEGELRSEAEEIEKQARRSHPAEGGEDLLKPTSES